MSRLQVRMKRELDMLQLDPSPGISCWCVNDKLTELQASKFTSNIYLIGFFFNGCCFLTICAEVG